MEKLSGKHFPAAVLKEVNDNMAMEELQQVQELEKELAAQYAAAQADAKRRIAVVQIAHFSYISYFVFICSRRRGS